jgi:hypothetical protein
MVRRVCCPLLYSNMLLHLILHVWTDPSIVSPKIHHQFANFSWYGINTFLLPTKCP